MALQIKELQEKYWDGSTTVEEEKLLKEYFRSLDSSDPEAIYFRQLLKIGQQQSSETFEIPGAGRIYKNWFAIAAVLSGILFGTWLIRDMQKSTEFLVEDPQEALEITRNALLTISNGMNKGSSYAGNIVKFEQAQEMISN
jgi:hypothetical protein